MADDKFYFVVYRKADQKKPEAELPKTVKVAHEGKTHEIAFGKASTTPFPKRVAVTLAGKHKNWTSGAVLGIEEVKSGAEPTAPTAPTAPTDPKK